MSDYEIRACGRGWDHPAHTWTSNPDRWCPGKGQAQISPGDISPVDGGR